MKVLHSRCPKNWVRGCSGKVRWSTRKQANEALALMRAKEPDKTLHVYRCNSCGSLHVGSKP